MEKFIRRPPESKPIYNAPEGYTSEQPRVVTVEKLPRELVMGVAINPFARDALSPDQKFIATEDFLMDAVRFVVPGSSAKDASRLLAPAMYGRALTTNVGRIPYCGLMGEQIVFKGIGPSGVFYPGEYFDVSQRANDLVNVENPTGILYGGGNELDQVISNRLLSEGARASLNLGHIILDPNKLMEFIEDKFKSVDPALARDMAMTIERASEEYQDKQIVISARVGGTQQRIEYVRNYISQELTHSKNRVFSGRVRGYIAHGARLMHDESMMPGGKFSRYLENSSLGEARSVLRKISEYKPLTEDDMNALVDITGGMAAYDGEIIQRLGKQNRDMLSLFHFYPMVKDIDFGFIHYDYDTVYPGIYVEEHLDDVANPQRYADNSATFISHYLWAAELLLDRDRHADFERMADYKKRVLERIQLNLL